jgi:hypothetical protein
MAIEKFVGVDRRFLIPIESPKEDGSSEEGGAISIGDSDDPTSFDDSPNLDDGTSGLANQEGGVAKGKSTFELSEDFEERKKKLREDLAREAASMKVCERIGVVKDCVKELVKEAYLKSRELSKVNKVEEYTVMPLVDQKPHETEYEVVPGTMPEYVHLENSVRKEIHVIQKQLMDIVLDEMAPRWIPGADKGKRIDRRLIARVPMGERKFFKYKIETNILNMAAFLLVDESGSMWGEKSHQARRCAIMFGKILDAIKIPCMIAGFTTTDLTSAQAAKAKREGNQGRIYGRTENLRHNIYKRFDEPYNRAKTKLVKISAFANNFDCDSMEYSWAQLQQYCLSHNIERKLLIVVSDSQPCGGPGAREKMIRVINEISCDPGGDVIGVGIQTSYCKDFFNKCIEINDVAQLGVNVVRLLKSAIKKGMRKW